MIHRFPGHSSSAYPTQHDANLVLSSQRHQKDLFTGGPSNNNLGIPDLTTHVGSVIQAFENYAYQRHLNEGAEKPYESSKSSSNSMKRETTHKIILPVPKKSVGTLTDSSKPHKQIVRHRPKGRAPDIPSTHHQRHTRQQQSSNTNTVSATTQTSKISGDENELLDDTMEILNMFDDVIRSSAKFPYSYVRNQKVLLPFEHPPPRSTSSRIPVSKVGTIYNNSNGSRARNNNSSSHHRTSSMPNAAPASRADVFLRPTAIYTETEIENDFLRGSEVSQSFIKNVVRKSSPHRKLSTYEQNFVVNSDNDKNRTKNIDRKSKVEKLPLNDEVSLRYTEHKSDAKNNKNNQSSSLLNRRIGPAVAAKPTTSAAFQPRRVDRAEL